MPLAPLWTSFLGKVDKLLSEATVEPFFKTIKTNVLQDKRSLHAGSFVHETIREMKTRVKSSLLHSGQRPHIARKRKNMDEEKQGKTSSKLCRRQKRRPAW